MLAPLPSHRLSDSAFDSLRLWVLVALCLLRLTVTRPHLQAYLCLAKARVEQLRREAGRIEAREIQRRVWAPLAESELGAQATGAPVSWAWSPPEARRSRTVVTVPAHQVVRVYCYVTVVSLQYLTPLILTLNCTLLLKTLGERWRGRGAGGPGFRPEGQGRGSGQRRGRIRTGRGVKGTFPATGGQGQGQAVGEGSGRSLEGPEGREGRAPL